MRTLIFVFATLASLPALAAHKSPQQIETCEQKLYDSCVTAKGKGAPACEDSALAKQFASQCGEGESEGNEMAIAKASLASAKASLARAKAQMKHAKRMGKLGKIRAKAVKAQRAVALAECIEERTGPDGGIPESEAKALCASLESK